MTKLVDMHVGLGKIGWRLFLLNLYWLIHTLMGGIILGIAPSTRVLYQQLIQDEKSEEIENKGLWQAFHTAWKKQFITANKLILPLILLIGMIFLEIRLLSVMTFTQMDIFISVALQVLFLALLTMLLNIFAFGGQQVTAKESYRQCLILVFGRPLFSLGSLVMVLLILSTYYVMPGLGAVFGISTIAFAQIKYLGKHID